MKDILIFGGFNWLGYELTKMFIEKNIFSNIIIVDNLENYLSKDNKIKRQFDNYRHLYDENIFMYNVNIKDKEALDKIYEKHHIKSVVNNIKFNCHFTDDEKRNILDGYANIVKLNDTYSVSKYIYLTRCYTHEKILFKQHKRLNLLEDNLIFNERTFLINKDKGHHVNLPDYIFGNKCYDSRNLFFKLLNIINIKSPIYLLQCSAYFLCDDLLLMLIYELLITDIDEKRISEVINDNVSGPHRYIDVFNYFESSANIRTVLAGDVEHSTPGIRPQHISESSLLGKYLQSLN